MKGLTLIQSYPCEIFTDCTGLFGNALASVFVGNYYARLFKTSFRTHEYCLSDFLTKNTDDRGFILEHKNNYQQLIPNNECINEDFIADAFENRPFSYGTGYDMRVTGQELYQYLTLPKDKEYYTNMASLSNTFTIYLRGRHNEDYHNIYVQAPCSYFDKILNDYKPRRLIIVTSTIGQLGNPCVNTMTSRNKHLNFEMYIHIGSIRESYTILMHASNLVISGFTSYGFMAALLNPNIKTLIMPLYYPNSTNIYEVSNGYEISDYVFLVPLTLPDDVTVVRYLFRDYPLKGIWSKETYDAMLLPYEAERLSPDDKIIHDNFKQKYLTQTTIFGCGIHHSKDQLVEGFNKYISSLREVNNAIPDELHKWFSHKPGAIIVLTCLSVDEVIELRKGKLFMNFPPPSSFYKFSFKKSLISFVSLSKYDNADSFCKNRNQQQSDTCYYDSLHEDVISYLKEENPYNSTHLTWYKKQFQDLDHNVLLHAMEDIRKFENDVNNEIYAIHEIRKTTY